MVGGGGVGGGGVGGAESSGLINSSQAPGQVVLNLAASSPSSVNVRLNGSVRQCLSPVPTRILLQ